MGINTSEEIHTTMVAIRTRLLDVGLIQQEIINGYDASETGSADQVPTLATNTNQYTPYMAFNFPDDQENPITVSFRVGYGAFFGGRVLSNILEHSSYVITVRVSKGVDVDGTSKSAELICGSTGNSSNSGSTGNSSSNSNSSNSNRQSGDYVRYHDGCLTMFIGSWGKECGWTINKYNHIAYIHVERVEGSEYVALGDTRGTGSDGSVAQKIFYSRGNTVNNQTVGNARSAGNLNLYDDYNLRVVSPVYYTGLNGGVKPLKKVYTIPSVNDVMLVTLDLDFTGDTRRYLHASVEQSNIAPYYPGLAYIFEWEEE